MNIIKIENTEIVLQNYEKGQGKIIISNLDQGSFSFYWGSMNDTIEGFLKTINPDYFAGKLCNEKYVFSGKHTAKRIRKWIKTEMKYDLPWYKFQACQKVLRDEIRSIESAESNDEALHIIEGFSLIYPVDSDYHETKEFLKIMEDHFSQEPWHFLETEPSPEYNFLYQLHKKLKTQL